MTVILLALVSLLVVVAVVVCRLSGRVAALEAMHRPNGGGRSTRERIEAIAAAAALAPSARQRSVTTVAMPGSASEVADVIWEDPGPGSVDDYRLEVTAGPSHDAVTVVRRGRPVLYSQFPHDLDEAFSAAAATEPVDGVHVDRRIEEVLVVGGPVWGSWYWWRLVVPSVLVVAGSASNAPWQITVGVAGVVVAWASCVRPGPWRSTRRSVATMEMGASGGPGSSRRARRGGDAT